MVVAYRNGAPVMLTDVAKIVDGVENNNQAAWMNKTPAVIVNVQRQPGANTINVVKRIKALMPQLQGNLPAGIDVTTLTDLTTPIQASVSDVEFELMLTVALVVMVMFLFLRNLYATIIPSVAVPLSLIGTFAAMYALDYSLDNLSLMASDHFDGFRGRRRHRHDGKYFAVHRRGRAADASGVEGRGTDRLHYFVIDGVPDCRAHSFAVHGRRGRAAVPRVCRNFGGHDYGFGGSFPDADADDGVADPEA